MNIQFQEGIEPPPPPLSLLFRGKFILLMFGTFVFNSGERPSYSKTHKRICCLHMGPLPFQAGAANVYLLYDVLETRLYSLHWKKDIL